MPADARPGPLSKVQRDVLSGSVAGVVATASVHPLDTLRTRLQTDLFQASTGNRPPQYSGALDCFRQTVRNEGWRALYRGMASPLAAQGLYKSVIFGVYGSTSRHLASRNPHNKLHMWQVFACGAAAGAANAVVVSPVELVRNRLMVERLDHVGSRRSTPVAVVRRVLATNTVLGMWRGLTPTVLRDGPGVGAYFAAFEGTRRAVASLYGDAYATKPSVILLGGAVGGIAFWTVGLPMDAIKSVLQTSEGTGISQVVRVIHRLNGVRGLYKGLSVAISRGIPSAAVTFYVQASASAYLDRYVSS